MILTICLLNAGRRPQTFERARKSPCNQIGQKKKEKKEVRKESGWDLPPRKELWKRFPHPGKSPHQQGDQLGQSFRASEENAATSFQQPEWTETCTVSATTLHSPAWDVHLLVRVGAGCWSSGFGYQTQREDWGWLCENSLKGLESGVTATEGVCGASPGHLRGQVPLFGGCTRGGVGPTTAGFFPACALRR